MEDGGSAIAPLVIDGIPAREVRAAGVRDCLWGARNKEEETKLKKDVNGLQAWLEHQPACYYGPQSRGARDIAKMQGDDRCKGREYEAIQLRRKKSIWRTGD